MLQRRLLRTALQIKVVLNRSVCNRGRWLLWREPLLAFFCARPAFKRGWGRFFQVFFVHRDHMSTCKITMHKTAFSHRAHNWLHGFLSCGQVLLMRFDFLVGCTLLRWHLPTFALPLRHSAHKDPRRATLSYNYRRKTCPPSQTPDYLRTSVAALWTLQPSARSVWDNQLEPVEGVHLSATIDGLERRVFAFLLITVATGMCSRLFRARDFPTREERLQGKRNWPSFGKD